MERLSTGLTAAALSAFVLLVVLVAGTFGLDRLTGGVFGAPPGDPPGPVIVFDADQTPVTGAPGGQPPAGPPAPVAPAPDLPPPAAAAPDPTPPAPDPTGPPPGQGPAPARTVPPIPPLGGIQDSAGSVVELTASTVESLGSTVGDTLGVVLTLVSSPPATASAPAPPDADHTVLEPPQLPR